LLSVTVLPSRKGEDGKLSPQQGEPEPEQFDGAKIAVDRPSLVLLRGSRPEQDGFPATGQVLGIHGILRPIAPQDDDIKPVPPPAAIGPAVAVGINALPPQKSDAGKIKTGRERVTVRNHMIDTSALRTVVTAHESSCATRISAYVSEDDRDES